MGKNNYYCWYYYLLHTRQDDIGQYIRKKLLLWLSKNIYCLFPWQRTIHILNLMMRSLSNPLKQNKNKEKYQLFVLSVVSLSLCIQFNSFLSIGNSSTHPRNQASSLSSLSWRVGNSGQPACGGGGGGWTADLWWSLLLGTVPLVNLH